MNSQAVILGSMTVVTVDSGIKSLLGNTVTRVPPSRIIIGGFLVTIALLLTSEASPRVAEGFAVLILAAELFGPTGGGLASAVSTVTKNGAPPKTIGVPGTIPGIGNVVTGVNPTTPPVGSTSTGTPAFY